MSAVNDLQTRNYIHWLTQRGLPESAAYRSRPSLEAITPQMDSSQDVTPALNVITSVRLGFLACSGGSESLNQEEQTLFEKILEATKVSPRDYRVFTVESYQALLGKVLPETLVLFGETFAKQLLGKDFDFTAQRGKIISTWQGRTLPSRVMVTFNLHDMLNIPANKKLVWQDLQGLLNR